MAKFSRVHKANATLFVLGLFTLALWQNCGNINLMGSQLETTSSTCDDDHLYAIDTSFNPLNLTVESLLRQTNSTVNEQYPGSVRWTVNDQEHCS